MDPVNFLEQSNLDTLGKKYPAAVERVLGKGKTLSTPKETPAYFVFVLNTDNDDVPLWA